MNRRAIVLPIALVAVLLAIVPPLLGLEGAWGAVHRLGGTVALAILLWAAWRVPGWPRVAALAAVVVSVVTIVILSSGGSIPVALQWLQLIVLGWIYGFCIWRAATPSSIE